jgi:polyhydroxyalkanoate synthesis regulator protein
MIVRKYKSRKVYCPNKGYINIKDLMSMMLKQSDIRVLDENDKDVTIKVLTEGITQFDFTEEELLEIIRGKITNRDHHG